MNWMMDLEQMLRILMEGHLDPRGYRGYDHWMGDRVHGTVHKDV